jgi:hypothetical protein
MARFAPTSFNVQFHQRHIVQTHQMMAIDFFGGHRVVDEWSQRMLFPEYKHSIWMPKRELGKATIDLEWVDPELNREQQVYFSLYL